MRGGNAQRRERIDKKSIQIQNWNSVSFNDALMGEDKHGYRF